MSRLDVILLSYLSENEQRSVAMLRNALAAVGLYVVGKKALGLYMEYRVLKEAYR